VTRIVKKPCMQNKRNQKKKLRPSIQPSATTTSCNRSPTLSPRLDLPAFWPGTEMKWEVWLLRTWFGIAPVNNLVSLTWLLWALRSFQRFTLHKEFCCSMNGRLCEQILTKACSKWQHQSSLKTLLISHSHICFAVVGIPYAMRHQMMLSKVLEKKWEWRKDRI